MDNQQTVEDAPPRLAWSGMLCQRRTHRWRRRGMSQPEQVWRASLECAKSASKLASRRIVPVAARARIHAAGLHPLFRPALCLWAAGAPVPSTRTACRRTCREDCPNPAYGGRSSQTATRQAHFFTPRRAPPGIVRGVLALVACGYNVPGVFRCGAELFGAYRAVDPAPHPFPAHSGPWIVVERPP